MSAVKPATIVEIKNYFGSEKEVSPIEMRQFWGSLTDEEKEFYKNGVAEIIRPAN